MQRLIFISVLLLAICCSCGAEYNQTNEEGETMWIEDEGTFQGIVEFNWNIDEFVITEIVIDHDIALKIGNIIIESKFGSDIIKKTKYVVFEIKGKDIIIVSRIPKNDDMLGGDYNVAISKQDGRILGIWQGE